MECQISLKGFFSRLNQCLPDIRVSQENRYSLMNLHVPLHLDRIMGFILRTFAMVMAVCQVQVSYAQTFINPSLEQWGDSTVCETNLPPDDWFDFSNAGLAPDEANYPLCPSSIPGRASDGRVYARFMAGNPVSGEGMHQVVLGFAVGRIYHVSFDYAGSNRWGGNDSCHFKLFLNGVGTDSTPVFSSRDTTWRRFDSFFVAPSTAIDFGVRALVPHYGGAGGSAAIDNFSFQESVNEVVEDTELKLASVFPNPFHDRLLVRGFGTEHVRLTIFDVSGRSLMDSEAVSGNPIDVSELLPGYYVVRLQTGSGRSDEFRLIKY